MNEWCVLEFQQFINDGKITIDVPFRILDPHSRGSSDAMIDK